MTKRKPKPPKPPSPPRPPIRTAEEFQMTTRTPEEQKGIIMSNAERAKELADEVLGDFEGEISQDAYDKLEYDLHQLVSLASGPTKQEPNVTDEDKPLWPNGHYTLKQWREIQSEVKGMSLEDLLNYISDAEHDNMPPEPMEQEILRRFGELHSNAEVMEGGIAAIAAERQRQMDVEGWTPEHDDAHDNREMVVAAVLYAMYPFQPKGLPWPWEKSWDKRAKHDPQKRLTVAGALIAAELDRLQRLSARFPVAPVADKPTEAQQAAAKPERMWQSRILLSRGTPGCIGYGSADKWTGWARCDAPQKKDYHSDGRYRYSEDGGETWTMWRGDDLEMSQAAAAMCGSEGVKQDSCGGRGESRPQSDVSTSGAAVGTGAPPPQDKSIAPAPEAVEEHESVQTILKRISLYAQRIAADPSFKNGTMITKEYQQWEAQLDISLEQAQARFETAEKSAVDWKALAVALAKAVKEARDPEPDKDYKSDIHFYYSDAGEIDFIIARIEQAEKRKDASHE